MLPAFVVRQVRPEDHPDPDGMVRLASSEYDELITQLPAAALSYMDEDDGETVTVGSSFELSQRLQEPVQNLKRSSSKTKRSTAASTASAAHKSQLHAFDVKRSEDVLREWRSFDCRTQECDSQDFQSQPNDGEKSIVDSEQRGPREKHFRATNPPTLKQTPATASSSQPGLDKEKEPSPQKSLTPEGKRQAEEAGSKLRSSIQPFTATAPTKIPYEMAHQDRWVRYGASPNSFTQKQWPPDFQASVSDAVESGIEVEQPKQVHQPLLDMFEAELAKLGHPKSVAHSAVSGSPINGSSELHADMEHPTLSVSSSNAQATAELSGSSSPARYQEQAAPAAEMPTSDTPPHPITPGEFFVHSLKSLGEGLGVLAASLKQSLPEVQRNIVSAHQRIPNNIDKALRHSLSSLGHVLEQVDPKLGQRPPTGPATSPVEVASVQATSLQNELDNSAPASSKDTVPSQPLTLGQMLNPTESEPPLPPRPSKVRELGVQTRSQDIPELSAPKHSLAPQTALRPQSPSAASKRKVFQKALRAPSGTEYQVQELIGRRFITYGAKDGPTFKQYLIRWSAYPFEEDVWYDVENLKHCEDLVRIYEQENPLEWPGQTLPKTDNDIRMQYLGHAKYIHKRTARHPMVVFDNGIDTREDLEVYQVRGPFRECDHVLKNYFPDGTKKELLIIKDASMDSADESTTSAKPVEAPVAEKMSSLKKKSKRSAANVSFEAPQADVKVDPSTRFPLAGHKDQSTEKNHQARVLRHRQSWHPASSTQNFDYHPLFSRESAMARFPPVAHLDAANIPDRFKSNTWKALPRPPAGTPSWSTQDLPKPAVAFPALPPMEPLVPQSARLSNETSPSKQSDNERKTSRSTDNLSWYSTPKGHLPSEIKPRSGMLRRAESARRAVEEAAPDRVIDGLERKKTVSNGLQQARPPYADANGPTDQAGPPKPPRPAASDLESGMFNGGTQQQKIAGEHPSRPLSSAAAYVGTNGPKPSIATAGFGGPNANPSLQQQGNMLPIPPFPPVASGSAWRAQPYTPHHALPDHFHGNEFLQGLADVLDPFSQQAPYTSSRRADSTRPSGHDTARRGHRHSSYLPTTAPAPAPPPPPPPPPAMSSPSSSSSSQPLRHRHPDSWHPPSDHRRLRRRNTTIANSLSNAGGGTGGASLPPSGQTRRCISELRELGFGSVEYTGGWDDKLKYVAECAGGDLNTAIDCLEEDRRVWEESAQRVGGRRSETGTLQ